MTGFCRLEHAILAIVNVAPIDDNDTTGFSKQKVSNSKTKPMGMEEV